MGISHNLLGGCRLSLGKCGHEADKPQQPHLEPITETPEGDVTADHTWAEESILGLFWSLLDIQSLLQALDPSVNTQQNVSLKPVFLKPKLSLTRRLMANTCCAAGRPWVWLDALFPPAVQLVLPAVQVNVVESFVCTAQL